MGCASSQSAAASASNVPQQQQQQQEQQQQQGRDRPVSVTGMVVDCGSGHASVLWYGTAAEAAGAQQLRRARLQIEGSKTQFRIADELAGPSADQCEERIVQACDLLDAEVRSSGLPSPTVLFVGATGGLREALGSGTVQQATLDRFTAVLQARFASIDRVRFLCLSGEQEAAWELAAARCIYAESARAMFPSASPDAATQFGLFSGGGQSMQLAGLADAASGSQSWPFSTWCEAMDESKGASADAWKDVSVWAQWEDALRTLIVAERARPGSTAPYSGCCVLVAMNEVAAKAAGFAEQPIDAATATEQCQEALRCFRTGQGDAYSAFLAKRSHYKYNVARVTAMHLCRLAMVLEHLFAGDAMLYAPDPKRSDLHCEWALGAFLGELGGRRLSVSTVGRFENV